jgi:hypothetical protein
MIQFLIHAQDDMTWEMSRGASELIERKGVIFRMVEMEGVKKGGGSGKRRQEQVTLVSRPRLPPFRSIKYDTRSILGLNRQLLAYS